MQSRTIVLAGREPKSRAAVRRMLLPLGCTIAEASDGSSAVHLAGKPDVAIVISELYLPCLPAPSLLRALRRVRALQHVALVAHAAEDTAEHRATALASGADAFFASSTDPERLRQTISALLRSRKVARRA